MCLPHKPAAVTAGQSPAVGGQVTPSPTLPHPSGAAQTLPSESDTPSALKGLNLGDGGLEQARMGFLRSSPPNRVWFGGGGICTSSISSHLDVLLGDEPGSVRQQFVDLVEVPEFLGGIVQPLQPRRVAPHPQELLHVQAHQVGALVPGCCLRGEPGTQPPAPARDPPKPSYKPLEKPRQGAATAPGGFSLGIRVQRGVSAHPLPSMPVLRGSGGEGGAGVP